MREEGVLVGIGVGGNESELIRACYERVQGSAGRTETGMGK